jgi:hypothetical protein
MRIAGVYTEYCELPSLASQIQRIYERQMLSHVFPGDMSHGQSLVDMEDVALAFHRVVERRARLPEETTLLIGEPITESYEALRNLIGRLCTASLGRQGKSRKRSPPPAHGCRTR